MKTKKLSFAAFLIYSLFCALYGNLSLAKAEEHSEKGGVYLSANAQQMAGVVVTPLEPQLLKVTIPAPGEVIPNANATTKITTRVPAQVVQRHVQEGEHVKSGQLLVTLSSVDMAKTQGNLLLASQEWERVKKLGQDAVSAKRYSEAQVAYQHAYSTALAYGMTETEITHLLSTQKPSQTNGEFKLSATHTGTIFNVSFTEGELVEPGRILLQIVDEKNVWVDAKLPPDVARSLKVGDGAQVFVNGRTLQGRVIQVHHQLDETTRTQSVRLEIPNTDDLLHPGQFINCQIETGNATLVLAMPQDAVLRTADGDWAVYVEEKPKQFQPVEVKLLKVVGKQAVIEGVAAGTRVVTHGAFFVHSELAKKGFDAHGH